MNEIALNQFPPPTKARLLFIEWIDWIVQVSKTFEIWNERHKTRRQFAASEARFLNDIGISESFRFIEANKPFWEQ